LTVLANLGSMLGMRGELRKAIELFEETMRLSEQHGLSLKVAAAAENLGVAHLELGELDEARRHLEAALTFYQGTMAAPYSTPNVMVNLADVAAKAGDLAQARSLALASIEAARKVEDGRTEIEALILLGDLAAAIERANAIDYPVGRRRAQLRLARRDRVLAEELVREVRATDDLLLESQALLALAEATGDVAVAREALELARSREQNAVVARAEAFLAAQPPANGGSTSS
jgi:hypothetical protein